MNEVLSNLSDALAGAVSAASGALVRIESRHRVPASGIIWSEEGIIVTNHHVIHRPEGIRVGLGDGRVLPGTLIGRDETTDLALLKIDAEGLHTGVRRDLEGLAVGNFVLALGRPGKSARATLGIVSALGSESWQTPAGGRLERYLQSDLTLYPGFTGGPLVDVEGRILGITSSAILRGIGITIPNGTIGTVVDMLLAHGHVPRGYLGISSYPVRLPRALAARLGQEEGLLIVGVEPESPAEQGGLMQGDVVISIGEESVSDPESLLASLTADRVGTNVQVKVIRAGNLLDVQVTVGERA